MIIAIDGPAGVGKSTIATKLSLDFDLLNLNTGSFYRAVTYHAIKNNLNAQDDEEAIVLLCDNLVFAIKEGVLFVNDVDLGTKLRSTQIDSEVPRISSISGVRTILNKYFQTLGQSMSLVVEGRDMTTVVFPNADYRFYLDADVEQRALRRFNESLDNESLDELKNNLIKRDQSDENKKINNLNDKKIYIDTTDVSLDGAYALVKSYIVDIR